jgi:hypothetical protein
MANPTSNYGWVLPNSADLVTDLPADFDVALQGVDTTTKALNPATTLGDIQYRSATANTNTRLPIGTTGQVLSVVAGVPAWTTGTTGDIEGVTVSSPITGGGTSGTVNIAIQDALTTQKGAVQLSDSTSTTSSILAATPTAVKSAFDLANAAIPKSTVTTTGDMIYATGSSAVTRRAIGSTGDVLTVSGGVPTWAAPASGAFTLLSTTTLSGSTTTISSIDQSYTDLYIMLLGAQESVSGNGMDMRWNSVTSGYIYNFTDNRNGTVSQNASGSTSSIPIPPLSTQNASGSAFVTINNYTATTLYKSAFFEGVFQYNGNPNYGSYYGVGGYRTAGAINSLTIFTSSGTLVGTVKIYGVK